MVMSSALECHTGQILILDFYKGHLEIIYYIRYRNGPVLIKSDIGMEPGVDIWTLPILA